MSWTKGQIITQAFNELGLAGPDYEPDPQHQDTALIRLEAMMDEWYGAGVRIGYNGQAFGEATLSQDTGVPNYALRAMYLNLAIEIADIFGKAVSPKTEGKASSAYQTVKTQTANEDPLTMSIPASMIRGAGYKATNRNIRRYYPKPKEELEVGPDDNLNLY